MRILRNLITASLLTIAVTLVSIHFVGAKGQLASPQQRQLDITCLSNEKQVALATLMYMQDYEQKMPPIKSSAQVEKLLFPYTKNTSIFTCPENKSAYIFNPKLSSVKLAAIALPASTPLLCDAKAHADGTWCVGYVDGHVKILKSRPAEFGPAAKSPATPKKPHK